MSLNQQLRVTIDGLARRMGAQEAVAQTLAWIAQQLWQALDQQHVAVPESVWIAEPDSPSDLKERFEKTRAWLASKTFPLVFEHEHWAFARYAAHEEQLASRFIALNRAAPVVQQKEQDADFVANRNEAAPRLLMPAQQAALDHALARQLLVLSGGPGTGKTFTLRSIVDALRTAQPGWKIFGAAPTGRAVQRMNETGIQFHDTATVDRWLERARGKLSGLACDVMVVDEATLLDAEKTLALLKIVQAQCRWIFAGDPNQLSSVRSGAVFAQLCQLEGAVAALTDSQRFSSDSLIGQLAQRILETRQSKANADMKLADSSPPAVGSIRELLNAWPATDCWWLDETVEPHQLQANQQLSVQANWQAQIVRFFQPLLDSLRSYMAERGEVALIHTLETLSQLRVLCAMHEGPQGTRSANQIMMRATITALRSTSPSTRPEMNSKLYAGRVIIIEKNDHQATGLSNGDVGIILPHVPAEPHVQSNPNMQTKLQSSTQLFAYFPGLGNAQHAYRKIPLGSLPPHADGWAMSVHKAQGSEFDQVLFAIPPAASPQARRELIYTAVTRARQRLVLTGNPSDLVRAASRATERFSTLAARFGATRARADGETPKPVR